MKLQEPMKTVKALVGDERAQERALLRRERHASASPGPTSRRRCASARKRSCARTRPRCARCAAPWPRKGDREDPDLVPELPAGPVALQGRPENGLLEADYIVVEMANRILGEDWMPEYVARANDGGIERVLV